MRNRVPMQLQLHLSPVVGGRDMDTETMYVLYMSILKPFIHQIFPLDYSAYVTS